jgi:hypothetical protein
LSAATGSPTTNQIAAAALNSGTGIVTALAAGASLTSPIISAAFAGVALGIQAILNSGCGQTCVVTSNWANQAEGRLKQNLEEYFSIPAPRPLSAQIAALKNFDAVWTYLYQQCSQSSLGTAGQNCIGDRQAGACKWKADAPPDYPGQPAQGDCWNWFNGYRDPIAKDTNVISDAAYESLMSGGSTSASSSLSSSLSTMFSGNSSMLLIAGAALLVLGMAGGKN